MLIAVSGSQGCGKTTILNKLAAEGYRVVDRKTSRSIQAEWGVALEDILADSNMVIKFQDEILKRKLADEKLYTRKLEPTFTERTFADLFTYAVIWLGRENKHSDYLSDYYIRCMRAQQTYSYVYYVKGGRFPVIADPNRAASNPHYSRLVDLSMYDFTQQMCHPSRLTTIDVVDIDTRVSMIKSQIESVRKDIIRY